MCMRNEGMSNMISIYQYACIQIYVHDIFIRIYKYVYIGDELVSDVTCDVRHMSMNTYTYTYQYICIDIEVMSDLT